MPPEGPTAHDEPFSDLDAYLESLTVRHDPRLHCEARADEIAGIVRVSSAFLSRAPELKRHELAHEAAHLAGLDDWYLRSHADWDLASRVSYRHLNGWTGPGEVIVEAYAVHWTDPGFLRLHAPGLIPAVREGARAVGLPLPSRHEPGSGPGGPGRLPPDPGAVPAKRTGGRAGPDRPQGALNRAPRLRRLSQ